MIDMWNKGFFLYEEGLMWSDEVVSNFKVESGLLTKCALISNNLGNSAFQRDKEILKSLSQQTPEQNS